MLQTGEYLTYVALSGGLGNIDYYVMAMTKKLYCDSVESILADHPTSKP